MRGIHSRLISVFLLVIYRASIADIFVDPVSISGKPYVRIIVPSGTLEQPHVGEKWKLAAFDFAMEVYAKKGTITPNMREQIYDVEKPTEKSGFVIVAAVTGPHLIIEGVIRSDTGLPFLSRLNSLIDIYNRRHTTKQAFLLPNSIATGRSFQEAKNFAIKGGNPTIGPYLVQSFILYLWDRGSTVLLETDLGGLSEYYHRTMGWQYTRVYNEQTGEDKTPPSWPVDNSRIEWIRQVNKSGKHVAILALTVDGLENLINKTARLTDGTINRPRCASVFAALF